MSSAGKRYWAASQSALQFTKRKILSRGKSPCSSADRARVSQSTCCHTVGLFPCLAPVLLQPDRRYSMLHKSLRTMAGASAGPDYRPGSAEKLFSGSFPQAEKNFRKSQGFLLPVREFLKRRDVCVWFRLPVKGALKRCGNWSACAHLAPGRWSGQGDDMSADFAFTEACC